MRKRALLVHFFNLNIITGYYFYVILCAYPGGYLLLIKALTIQGFEVVFLKLIFSRFMWFCTLLMGTRLWLLMDVWLSMAFFVDRFHAIRKGICSGLDLMHLSWCPILRYQRHFTFSAAFQTSLELFSATYWFLFIPFGTPKSYFLDCEIVITFCI